jgi:O-antigen/teichoic acid export membrane protein
MSLRQSGRFLHFFGTGVLDQIMLSGANFIAGFAMIRYASDVSYGQFVLAQSVVVLMVSAQSAWLSGPVTIIAPGKSAAIRAQMTGFLGASQTRFLRRAALALLAIPLVADLIGIWSAYLSLAVAVTILAVWAALQNEYRRRMLLVYSRPQSMLAADAIYVTVFLLGIALALLNRPVAGLLAIVALGAAGLSGALIAHRMLAVDPGWVSGDSGPFWREIRALGQWSLIGAVIYWLFGQSWNYVLAARLDLTAVANVNAVRLVVMPMLVFKYGIQNLLIPVASNWLASFGLTRMLRRLAVLTILISAMDLIYFTIVWNIRNWLIVDVMHKHIGDQDRLLILWVCVTLVFLPREILQAALSALKCLRSMAWLIGLSAAVSLSLMWLSIPLWGASAVLIGQLAGEGVNLLGLSLLLWRQIRQRPKIA